MRNLFATPQFSKDIKSIPTAVKRQADFIILLLREDPCNQTIGIKKLHGVKPATWRVRVGVYRLIYTFTTSTLTLHRFRHRKDVYRNL